MKKFIVFPILFAFFISPTTQAQSSKPVVAVGPVEIAAQNISCEGWQRSNCNQDLTYGFRQMLETAITKSRKMDVMERGQVDVLVHEQGLGQLGFTDAGGQMGGFKGVDYYLYGTITSFGEQVNATHVSGDTGIGSLFGGTAKQVLGGGATTSKSEVIMGVDLKVTEVSTGRIMIADSLRTSASAGSGFSVGGITQVDATGDPFADVQRALAAQIAEKIVTTVVPIKVIKVQSNGVLILNYGDIFLEPGQQLLAFEVGESFVDPDTGETLGSEEIELGRVEITRAEAKFSRAMIMGEPFEASGTILRKVASLPKKKKKKTSNLLSNNK